jgi:Abnormal spindle-like microcephaly-assoc'd, ASPM-SPD-2-Hydin
MKQWFSKSMERPPIRILFFGVLIFTLVIAAFPVTTFLTSTLADAGLNAIQMENNLPGDPSWNDFASSLTPDQLSGYGSKISVNHSDAIDFFVTTTDPSFSIDIYRTGWYHGNGARKITSLGTFTGVHQAIPTPDPVTGMVSCNWTKTTTLTIPSDWVSGVYLARLNGSDGDKSFIFFVVRNDGGNEDLLFQTSVTTYQAYNKWGDTSLYNNVTDKSVFSGPHATKVSFDRPFNPGDSNGAGHYFFYEYKFVYWMESQGYNVAYTTDVDTDGNVSTLTNHKGFLSVGHDEYWSKGMRDTVQQAINAGVNVAFFGANAMYWQIRFEPDAAGNAKRVEVGYKDYATETLPPGPDPMWNVNNAIVTTNWRSNPVNNPENGIMGVMFENEVNQTYPFVVQDASNWVFAGTGFANGSSIPGIVGYEYDNVFNNGATPAGLAILGHSPVVDPNGANSYSAATLYTAPSGAHVFAAGTIQWSWGLANTQGNTYMNAGIQKATANILNTFINGLGPSVILTPNSLDFGNQNVGTSSATKTITVSNSGTAALNISSVMITGTNTSDFAQTNDCPASLAVNASCTISVIFTPASTGVKTASVTLTDNAANSPQTVSLGGTGGTAAPAVTLNPSSLSFGNQAVGSTSSAQTVTLTNSGASALTITSIAVNGTNAGDFAQNNNCPASLAANASCTISVTFTPTTSGNRSASLTFADNAGNSPQTVALSGTSNTSTIYLSDGFETGDLSKWTLPSGDSTGTRTVQSTVVNNGNNALQFNNASGQYAYVYTTLPSGPQAQTFTRFYLRYDSSVTSGTQLAIARNANGGNIWELDYNAARHGLDVYFWNATNGVLTISSPSNVLSPNTWYSIEVQDTESVNGQAQVWLNGTSIGTTTGDLSTANPYARLMLFDSSPGKMYLDDVQVASTYNGPATASPHVTFNPTSLSFGSQTVGTTSAAKPVTLTNTGTATLTLNTITFTQEDPSDFAQTNDCPATLAVNASCTINVTFTPTAAGGRDANLTVTDNATDSPQSVILSGTGVVAGPAVTLNPSSVSFSNQNVGSPSPAQTVTLTNSGTSSLTISNITLNGTNAGDFAQTNNCPATLAVNVSCTISISFAPTATGARTASLAVTDNAIDSPQSLTLSGTGVSSTIYFSDSFESGNLNQWTLPNGDSTGTIAAQSNVVHTGTYALAFTNTGGQYAYVYTVLPSGPQSQTFTKFSFYCGSNVTSGTQFAIARNNNGGNVWEVDYNANRHGLDIYFWNGANTIFIISTPSNVLNANTWYNIEIEDIQASNGQAQVWLNGTSVGTVNGDLSMANPYARLMFYDSAPGTISIDDVLVSNSH